MRIQVRFEQAEQEIAVQLGQEDMNVEANMGEHMEIVQPVLADHRQLGHRDAPDQHPIQAITALTDELAGKQDTLKYASNADIDAIFRAALRRREKYYG